MNALTPIAALDIMNAHVLAKLRDGSAFILLGYDPLIVWEGVPNPNDIDKTKFYLRVSHQTILDVQSTLSNCESAPGKKRYTVSGLTFVQFFGPKTDPQVSRNALKLATIARDAFSGALHHSGDETVWFRNARINNGIPPENDLYRINVVTEHEYDEFR